MDIGGQRGVALVRSGSVIIAGRDHLPADPLRFLLISVVARANLELSLDAGNSTLRGQPPRLNQIGDCAVSQHPLQLKHLVVRGSAFAR
jgi:hypothetical protein